MPIHAAGIYDNDGTSRICVADFFVSSYTPSLDALLEARKRPVPTNMKVLVAAQPNPGMRWRRLVKVKDELQVVIQAVPKENLIHLSDSCEPDYEGINTTVENVVKKLPEANVLHLACHGTQDPNDPFMSGFILAGGKRLTIEQLMKCRLPNAHVAILSACHTASNDVVQPYEELNLASALLHLGFSSIIATKWYVMHTTCAMTTSTNFICSGLWQTRMCR